MTDPALRSVAAALDLARVAEDQLAAASDLRAGQGLLQRFLTLFGLALGTAGRPSHPHPESVRRGAELLDEFAVALADAAEALGVPELIGEAHLAAGRGDDLWHGRMDGWEARRAVDRAVGMLERALVERSRVQRQQE